jgi:hypothetical protein
MASPRRFNKEDNELGKFWQARFRAVRLLDETAILACGAYVDLNPVRAAMAETIETSDFTSAQKRALDLQAKESSAASKPPCGQHLAPVDLHERSGKTGPCANKRNQRCSNKGFLPMSTADYLSLLDWTAGQTVAGKQGSTPQHLAPIFDRLGITSEMWCRLVKDFGRLFSLVAGQSQCIDEHRSQSSSHRYRTRKDTRELLASA